MSGPAPLGGIDTVIHHRVKDKAGEQPKKAAAQTFNSSNAVPLGGVGSHGSKIKHKRPPITKVEPKAPPSKKSAAKKVSTSKDDDSKG